MIENQIEAVEDDVMFSGAARNGGGAGGKTTTGKKGSTSGKKAPKPGTKARASYDAKRKKEQGAARSAAARERRRAGMSLSEKRKDSSDFKNKTGRYAPKKKKPPVAKTANKTTGKTAKGGGTKGKTLPGRPKK